MKNETMVPRLNTYTENIKQIFESKVVDTAAILDTISIASIKEDEEGTNLNAKGINTDYVKHYNSINKTREEFKMPFQYSHLVDRYGNYQF
jgi:hypothetical protein